MNQKKKIAHQVLIFRCLSVLFFFFWQEKKTQKILYCLLFKSKQYLKPTNQLCNIPLPLIVSLDQEGWMGGGWGANIYVQNIKMLVWTKDFTICFITKRWERGAKTLWSTKENKFYIDNLVEGNIWTNKSHQKL